MKDYIRRLHSRQNKDLKDALIEYTKLINNFSLEHVLKSLSPYIAVFNSGYRLSGNLGKGRMFNTPSNVFSESYSID